MLDFAHLERYKITQIQSELNGLTSGYKLYHKIAYIFLGLTIAFFTTSLVFGIMHLTNILSATHLSEINFILALVSIALFCACLIIMCAMFITTRYKYTLRIRILKRFITQKNIKK